MKRYTALLATTVLAATLLTAHAQPGGRGGMMGGPPAGPSFGGDMAKIFGSNSNFTATMEFQTSGGPNGASISMPGKIEYLDGKSRFEMDMTEMKGAGLPPEAGAQLKQMGMDKMIMISRPDKKVSYIVYPGMQGYLETPIEDATAGKPESDFKVQITKIGDEKINGHDCVKNKVIISDKDGKTHESTVWNATDLKSFPLKIESSEDGKPVVMLFKDVKIGEPEGTEFEPPAGFKKASSPMELIMGHMQGMPGR